MAIRLRMSVNDARGIIGDVSSEIASRINEKKYAEFGPNNDKMLNLIYRTLENIFQSGTFLKQDKEALKEVIDAYPDAYDIIDNVFFELYEGTDEDVEICKLIKGYVKDYLTAQSGIINGYRNNDDVIKEEITKYSDELKKKFYKDMGIYFEEW